MGDQTTSEIGGVIRTLLATGAGYLVGKGLIDEQTATALVGAIGSILVAAWSIYQKRVAAAALDAAKQF